MPIRDGGEGGAEMSLEATLARREVWGVQKRVTALELVVEKLVVQIDELERARAADAYADAIKGYPG